MKGTHSLRTTLILLSMGVLVTYYFLVFLFSALFMEPYYLHEVEQTLVSAYHTLDDQGTYNLSVISDLEENNLFIMIADKETGSLLYNSHPSRPEDKAMLPARIAFLQGTAEGSETGFNIISDDRLEHTTSGANYSSGKRVVLGGVTDLYVLEISTSYASVSKSAEISMQFSLVVGLMVMLLAILAYSRLSAKVTDPITQITSIAGQIAHLDFSQKCNVQIGGEIGAMAESVNTMSDFMQSYIDQLQSANDQLKADIARQKAQEEARKDLVANLSHDLKTPIGLISGYADGLRSGMAKTDAEVREYCDVISDESERMMTLILKMMELFRLESGTVQLEPEEFDLYDLLSYQLEIFSREIELAGLQLTTDLSDCMYVKTDYFAAEQVITNYMQNALTHINGGKQLSVSAKDAGGFYRVSIFNSSAPIPQEEIPKLWDSFYRLDKSRTRSRRESGLGLSIVRSNMELLGGRYGMDNVDGGVIFWAEFPKSSPQEASPSDETE